jgi:FkbM family methyltransferase
VKIHRLKHLMHSLFRKFGYDFLRHNKDNFVSLRRAHILQSKQINLLLDIGANVGTYAITARHTGYKGFIISFEPLTKSYHILKKNAVSDPKWYCQQLAIGETDSVVEINVSNHITSSSLLPILLKHVEVAPNSAYIGKEKIQMKRLDNALADIKMTIDDKSVCIKADVQGYEKFVLEGATDTLKYTSIIEIELSFFPLYETSPLFIDIVEYLAKIGFSLVSIEPVFSDPKTGYVLQADGIFVRI